MKKIIACGLLLTMLGSVGTMCFAMNVSDKSELELQIDKIYALPSHQFEPVRAKDEWARAIESGELMPADQFDYLVCSNSALELNNVAKLRDSYINNVVVFWNKANDLAYEEDGKLYIDEEKYNEEFKRYESHDNEISACGHTLSMNRCAAWGMEMNELFNALSSAQRNVYGLYTDGTIFDGDSEYLLNRYNSIDWSCPQKYKGCGTTLFENIHNNYEDILPEEGTPNYRIGLYNPYKAALAVILMHDSFDKVEKDCKNMAIEAQNLSDKLYADECIAFANAWGYEE